MKTFKTIEELIGTVIKSFRIEEGGLILLAVPVLIFGLLLHSVQRGRVEVKRLIYLMQKLPDGKC